MRTFKLPDLGEGLHEAEIVRWYAREGDWVEADQPLVSVETEKAVVEIPSPRAGKIERIFAHEGERLHVGAPLVGFEGEPEADRASIVGELSSGATPPARLTTSPSRATQSLAAAKGWRATPAVRALAAKLGVDLTTVAPSGPDGLITITDVQRVAAMLAHTEPAEPLRGVRRAMARNMSLAQAEVAAATVMDDADIHAWYTNSGVTVRLIRALLVACRAEPALNAWYDVRSLARRVFKEVHLGVAVDTPDGLFVPVLRNAGNRSLHELRKELDALIAAVRARTIKAADMRSHTITLSNFGTLAGRYAMPIVVPPTVAIVGAGKVRDAVVPWQGQPAIHPILPLSITFDHRAVTGGEAARFLAAMIADLERSDG